MSDLRNLLGEVAENAKYYDVTEAAVRGARRRHRIRATAPIAAFVAIALVVLAVWLPNRHTNAQKAPPAHRGAQISRQLDVIAGRTLYTTTGPEIALPDDVTAAYNLPGGDRLLLLATRDAPGGDLIRLRPDGTQRGILTDVTSVVMDPSGTRIAWTEAHRGGRILSVGQLLETGVLVDASTHFGDPTAGDVPDMFPQQIVGSGDQLGVVLAEPTGQGYGAWDVWYPAQGAYHPTPHPEVRSISGTLPGTSRLVGTVFDDVTATKPRICLAVLDPAHDLAVGSKTCHAPFHDPPQGIVSPGGYLLQGSTTGVLGYRFDGADPKPTGSWRLGGYGTSMWDGAWEDDTTALLACDGDQNHLVRISTTSPGKVSKVKLPSGGSGHITIVRPLAR